ncbi:LPP20 family lipoprotein [candidate division WOR-3 bacterium]|nr:LPP20 family lipoprotein [candidate division WOR-3 bacterium]
MRTKVFLCLKAFLVILLFGCATTEAAKGIPEWVNNPNKAYPDGLYLSAVGSGSSREEAERDAMTSLSSIFSVDVTLDRRIIETYTEDRKGKDIDVQHTFNLLTKSALKSENKLINVKVGKSTFDEKTGTFYVLVYLNRMDTEPLYLKEIEKNDNLMYKYYNTAQGTEEKLKKFIYLKKAMQIATLNDGLRKIHRIITQFENTPTPPITKEDLNVLLEKLSSEIIAIIKVRGQYPEEFAGFLREVIQETGFTTGRENGDLIINATLKISPIDLPRKEKFVRWRLLIDVNNALTNTTMETFTREGREGHVSREAAGSRALREVKKTIKNEFYIEFNRFLNRSIGDK